VLITDFCVVAGEARTRGRAKSSEIHGNYKDIENHVVILWIT
jgi:hypothetical protein